MTVQELINHLTQCPPTAEVRLSVENNHALDRIEEAIKRVECYTYPLTQFVVLSD